MLLRVADTVSRYGIFAPGQRVGVAVSAGADSVCLLHILAELAPRWNLTLSVLHLNHLLRGKESDADEEFSRILAAQLGLEFHGCQVDVRRVAQATRDNLEQAARRVRKKFFLDFLARGVLDRVALGHTRSDQAETVLFRFLRGAGTAGLAGMRPVTPEGLVRPLIETTRPEIHDFLVSRGIRWREDSSNNDRAFARNRIRQDLLPALTRDWNPNLTETLGGLALIARDEEDYWEGEVTRIVGDQLLVRSPTVSFRTDWVQALPRAVARRVLRKAIETAKGDLRAIDLRHIEGTLELIDSSEGSGRLQIPGVDVFRSFDWVRLAPPGTDTLAARDYEVPASVPGRFALPHGGGVLALELIEVKENSEEPGHSVSVYNGDTGSQLNWDRISGSLLVRNWRPGDQYRPIGHANAIKIKDLFQKARVPLWERRRWPVLTCKDAIVWTMRFGPAAEVAADLETRILLSCRVGEEGEL